MVDLKLERAIALLVLVESNLNEAPLKVLKWRNRRKLRNSRVDHIFAKGNAQYLIDTGVPTGV